MAFLTLSLSIINRQFWCFSQFFWCFVFQLPRLTPYVRFCSCQLKACQLLQHKAETNPEFKQQEKVMVKKKSWKWLKSRKTPKFYENPDCMPRFTRALWKAVLHYFSQVTRKNYALFTITVRRGLGCTFHNDCDNLSIAEYIKPSQLYHSTSVTILLWFKFPSASLPLVRVNVTSQPSDRRAHCTRSLVYPYDLQ